MSEPKGLRVLVDGSELEESQARAMWQRFSAWMDAHPGDLAGFAQREGYASVHPELHDGRPVLVASQTGAQRAYRTAPERTAQARPRRDGRKGDRGEKRR